MASPDAGLLGVIRDLSFARELDEVTAVVRSAARRLTGADGVTFVLRDGGLCYYADEDAIGPLWKGQRFPMGACISGWVMLNGEAAVIDDIYADARIPADAYRPTFVRSLAMVPVRRDAPIGAIGAYWATRRRATPDEVGTLEDIADAAALALANVELYQTLRASLEHERQAREAAEAASRARDELLSLVSHELRTPLNPLRGWLVMLQQGQVDTADLKRVIGVMLRSVALLSRHIDALLDAVRLAGGEVALSLEQCELGKIVKDAVDGIRGEAAIKKISVWFRPAQAEMFVSADPARLAQVVTSLLSNAVKFTPAGGHVQVSVGRAGDRAQIVVSDTGIGLAPSALPHIFDLFRQVDPSPTRHHGGLGLGLAIAKHLVELHGGTVSADSAGEGKGSTFRVALPIAR